MTFVASDSAASRVVPGRMLWLLGGVASTPPFTMNTLVDEAFQHLALAHDDRFVGACVGGLLFHQHVGEQRRALDVTSAPAEILHRDRGQSSRPLCIT